MEIRPAMLADAGAKDDVFADGTVPEVRYVRRTRE